MAARKLLATVVCIWALQGTPVLCAAGWIWHLCEDDCGCPHTESEAEPRGCSHEQDCPDDPCSGLHAGVDRHCRFNEADLQASFDTPLPAIPPEPASVLVRRTCATHQRAAPNLPLPPSDVPLLI